MKTKTAILWALIGACLSSGCIKFSEECGEFCEAGGSGGSGGGTTTTTIDPGCIPSQTPNPVRDDCGVFVSSSAQVTNPDGSQEKPYKTIGDALASARPGPVYLCAETFVEEVHIKSGTTIYGGLDCTNGWTWSANTKSVIAPAADAVPMVIDPQVALVAEDIALKAADASLPGGSSIAMIASASADITLERATIETGNANNGAEGDAFAMSAANGEIGNNGADACSADVVVGGKSVQNACDEADTNDDSVSGSGGNGQEFSGANGSDGLPLGTINGGSGQPSDAGMCTPGSAGDSGTEGSPGNGAQSAGGISASGYTGLAGNPGTKGSPGQGGGGGGGAKGGKNAGQCPAATPGGASGASGGAGGCGGLGGNGGGAGGASIGVISLGATLRFSQVNLSVQNGGNGGNGGLGQTGGAGGMGGIGGKKGAANNLKDACNGGSGGSGGNGGRGGGGLGGPSIGIAYTGATAPDVPEETISIGAPGTGGEGDGPDGNGAAGAAAKIQSFGL